MDHLKQWWKQYCGGGLLAMILAASCRDDLVITEEDLKTSNDMVTTLEADMPRVFGKIGRTDISVQAERFT